MYLNHLFQQIDGDQTQPPPLQTPVTASHPLPAHLSPTVPPDSHPKPTNDEAEYDENENDDDDDDDDDDTKPQPIVGKKRKQELHRRHSKRYRDNLGELFQNLEQLLPKVVPGCKLKTKSQIIANSVQAVKRLRTEVSALEMQFVLSSPANRTKWVEDTVQAATCFQAVTEPFMRLLVGIQRWKHSELWCRYEVNLLPDGTDSGAPVINPTNTVHDLGPLSSKKFFLKLDRTVSVHDITASTVPEAYRMFSKISHMATFVNGDDSIVGRTASKLSPEWIDLRDPEACHGFKRGEAARQCGFTTCFALPFLVRGHVFASILFYDDQQRFDAGPDINIAQDIASCLGNCYGASAAQSSD
ncbi:unnamed protein product [Chondrus crispus]|uniref:BHLH domain-containing protein n=1 Tax=Chondrus crispus TaxID=2769 RepID=R7Q204_CHOCR|nr:unnamed protein product [Chondrus crispus]CDF32079.1 unnamed protein product [Chondrus crispus]|eukprot:XP_005711744.1 unnamed protein product [Chondrus crispus]